MEYPKGKCFPFNLLASKALAFLLFLQFFSTLTSFSSYFSSVRFAFLTFFPSTLYLISSPFSPFLNLLSGFLIISFILFQSFLTPLLDCFLHFLSITNFGFLNKHIINLWTLDTLHLLCLSLPLLLNKFNTPIPLSLHNTHVSSYSSQPKSS